jgi:sulfatase maturation enzyme AslB (radical SAM superfamily)
MSWQKLVHLSFEEDKMRAQNLSICIPYNGCDKNCPYCVSNMTGKTESNAPLMARNIEKVKTIAKSAQVTSVSVTGKGEPTMNPLTLFGIIEAFNEWPIELQTNGLQLLANLKEKEGNYLYDLMKKGLDIVAISIDKWGMFDRYKPLFDKIREYNMTLRVTVPVTDYLNKDLTLEDFINKCKECKIEQLSFRQVTVPNFGIVDTDAAWSARTWIERHVPERHLGKLINRIKQKLATRRTIVRQLPYGAVIVDMDGIAVTYFDYCIQDSNNGSDIRSLVFQEDGHLYTSWNSKASRLF